MRNDVFPTLIRYALLLLVCMLLVVGFYFHGEFYQLGLPLLLVVGSLATAGVIITLRITISDMEIAGVEGQLSFGREDIHSVLTGVKNTILDIPRLPIPTGSVYTAVVVEGSERGLRKDISPGGGVIPFADLLITESRRIHREDITEKEAKGEGFDSKEELLGFLDKKVGRLPFYHLIRFRVIRTRGEAA